MAEQQFAVVGGTSGIGQALVQALSAEQHPVWNLSRTPGPEAHNPQVRNPAWDVTVGGLGGKLPERLDGLVYCPGNIRLRPFARTGDEDFLQDFELNCLGAVRALRALLQALRKAPSASVVLISRMAAELAPRIPVNPATPSVADRAHSIGL